MEETTECLIEWVSLTQLNHNQLKHRCSTLQDLSDGVILFQLMCKVSPQHFQMEVIILQTKDNWALKLSNLRRLQKSIDTYIDNVLQVSRQMFSYIDLPSIAREGAIEQTIKLLQLVIFTVVNCPNKHTFIHRILELDQATQTHLMYFIQKIVQMQKTTQNWNQGNLGLPSDEISIKKSEYNQIRQEKMALVQSMRELKDQMEELKANNQKLLKQKQELKSLNQDLQNDLKKRQNFTQDTPASHAIELECQISEYQMQLTQLQNFQKVLKRQHQTEIEQLKDQIDVANSKLVKLTQLEHSIENYKKRLQKQSDMKKRNHELQRNCETFRSQLSAQQRDIRQINLLKDALHIAHADLIRQKEKSENLVFMAKSKDKQLKKLQQRIGDLQKIQMHLQNRIHELQAKRKPSIPPSQNSFMSLKSDSSVQQTESEQNIQTQNSLAAPFVRRQSRSVTNVNVYSTMQQFIKLRENINYNKERLKEEEERLKMYKEQTRAYSIELLAKIDQLERENQGLSEQIFSLNRNLESKSEEKFNVNSLVYQLEQANIAKTQSVKQIEQLTSAKDQLYKKLNQVTQDLNSIQGLLAQTQNQLGEAQSKQLQLKGELQSMEEKEKIYISTIEQLKTQTGESQTNDLKVLQLENQNHTLYTKLNSQRLQLSQKESHIQQMQEQHEVSVKAIQESSQQKVVQMQEECNLKINKIVNQTEEALSELNKEREQLAAKLHMESKRMKFQRNMTLNESKLKVKSEVQKFRSESLRKDKNIEYLIKANSELRSAWKDTTKLLRMVWRELGLETRKIEQAISRRGIIKE